jgi:hypothetical protein
LFPNNPQPLRGFEAAAGSGGYSVSPFPTLLRS